MQKVLTFAQADEIGVAIHAEHRKSGRTAGIFAGWRGPVEIVRRLPAAAGLPSFQDAISRAGSTASSE